MNAQEWEKLRQNWSELLEVQAQELSYHLYEKGILDSNDKDIIASVRTNTEQMDKLLSILQKKPLKLCVFKVLLSALEIHNKWLADKITETVSKADASICSQVDPHLIDEKVRFLLRQYYTNKPGTVPLLEIREILKSDGVFTGQNEWSNEMLIHFIKCEFLGVVVVNHKKPNLKNKKPTILLKNIDKIDPSEEVLASPSVEGDKK
ncbi:unnamed protein product, partial [Lymnaea stagnalis]